MRIRLKVPAYINNHRHDAGDVIDLPEGIEGPHRTKRLTHDRIDYGTNPPVDANRILGELDLEPLFDVVHDEPKAD